MTADRKRVFGIFVLIALAASGQADGSFERLPGPALGRNGDWAWDWPDHARRDRGARFSIGAPAAVPGLGWTHARARASISRWRFEGDAYLLSLDGLYHEAALGIWCARKDLTIGVRRWEVAWDEGPRRAGWALSMQWAPSFRGIEAGLAAQDIRIGGRDPSAPPPRVGCSLRLWLSPMLRIGGGIFRDPLGSGYLGTIRWVPLPGLALQETIRTPDNPFESGIELCAKGATIGLWIEPSVGLGSRVGISCALE